MAVGMVTGAALASAQTSAASANAYNSGYVAGTNTASSTNAYNAGYVAGSSNTAAAAASGGSATYPVGAIYATLPAGCMQPSGLGSTYYLCGNNWFKPSYGANGVYYRVVPAP
jgi:hypothetical protein